MEKKLYNKKQLAQALMVDPKTIYRFRNKGMPFLKLGARTVRYDFDECVAWLKNNQGEFDIPYMSPSPSQGV